MSVRPFDWRDLTVLHRYRHKSVFLNSALLLTRGPMLVQGALLSYLAPAMGIFTCVSDDHTENDLTLIGQVIHTLGSQFAHLTFLAPDNASDMLHFAPILDYMVALSGERGAFRLLADVDEHTEAFEVLRQGGFAIYTRQRIWQWTEEKLNDLLAKIPDPPLANNWRTANGRDTIAIRSLYNNLVPGLVQQAEPFVAQHPKGLVYYQDGELLAYVELQYGHRGIWAQPFIHPDAEGISDHFLHFLQKLRNRHSRPVYLCVRSYQSWLETAIDELGAECGPKQAVMVKHLAVQQKALRTLTLPALEGGQAEISAPIAHSEMK